MNASLSSGGRSISRTIGRIYGAPLALAALNGIGLLSALVADGFWDGVSWIALSASVVVIVWFVLRKETSGNKVSEANIP